MAPPPAAPPQCPPAPLHQRARHAKARTNLAVATTRRTPTFTVPESGATAAAGGLELVPTGWATPVLLINASNSYP